MYSGTSLTRFSGKFVGAHQKIDRVARRHLSRLLIDNSVFPTSKKILHFEGNKGPDAIKLKSPAKDELWHYYNPFDDKDTRIHDIMTEHFDNLVNHLKKDNQERVAFEAAWLAHALVDGLTPAHHFPYEEKLTELRGGEGIESRTSYKAKLFMPGQNRRDKFRNNWQMWGPRGLMPAHMMFEFGVASIFALVSFSDCVPTKQEVLRAHKLGLIENFKKSAREIAVLEMYDQYLLKGWTPRLANMVRHKLGPIIIKNVTIAWYLSLVESGLVSIEELTDANNRRKFRRKKA